MKKAAKEAAIQAIRNLLIAAYRDKADGGNREEWDAIYGSVKSVADQVFPECDTDKEAILAEWAFEAFTRETRR